MTIETTYNIGDLIVAGGVEYKILAVHLYESKNKHTERYYLGNELWLTIRKEGERK